jgi:hypothetical protein
MDALRPLIRAVRRNSDISDARFAGAFSVCGLALRLRDLFKWEKGLAPWEEGAPSEVLEWIGRREELWETLAEADYEPIPFGRRRFDPFDTESLNARLQPHGLLYGAGYARGLKPTFFLAQIDACTPRRDAVVCRLGRELARDLLTLPALTQDRTILLRGDAGRLNLWDEIFYAGTAGRRALAMVRDACGLPDLGLETLKRHFAELLGIREKLLLRHELGELHDKVFDRSLWREIIGEFPHTPVELLARSLKDLLADTHPLGPLPAICRRHDRAALGLYLLSGNEFTRALAPEIPAAFDALAAGAGWEVIEKALAAVRAAARAKAESVCAAYRRRRDEPDPSRFNAEMARLLESVGRRG